MTDKKDAEGNLLPDADRMTKIGSFVRKTSLAEIPQADYERSFVWNEILKEYRNLQNLKIKSLNLYRNHRYGNVSYDNYEILQ